MDQVHMFPLPEAEVHKLDEIRTQLPRDADTLVATADQWIRANALASTIIAGAVGYLTGRCIMRRRE